MSNRTLPLAIIGVVVIGAVLGYIFFFRPNQNDPPLMNDEPSDDDTEIVFTLTTGDETTIDDLLADEKPLVIYFFATWCPTCRRDLINLNSTHPQYEDEISILVVGFDPTESLEKIRDYKEGRDYQWPFAVYSKDAVTEFQIVSQASKVGISLEGEVVFTQGYGVVSGEGWETLFQELT
jgi:peroxiredoxin